MEDAFFQMARIRAWWADSGAVHKDNIPAMESWLSWWQFGYRHWGQYMRVGLSFAEDANMPTTNNSEVVHSVWWRAAGNGETKATVVTVAEFNIARVVIQSS
jgi:hypothetical protein